MSKFLKIFFLVVSCIIVIFAFNNCYAIDFNLTDNSVVNNDTVNTSNSSNSINSNQTTNSTTSNATNQTNNQGISSATVTNMLPESNLGLSTILNIFLIVIGILLVLLAIAILIRLKK